jgi:hypothetical protein
MPPTIPYQGLELWGLVVTAHGVLLAILDGRDHVELPNSVLNRLIEPRERRWSLFIIDAAVWIIFTMAIASRVIPETVIFQYVVPLSLLWLAHTTFGVFHVLLMIYAEVRDHTRGKRKNNPIFKGLLTEPSGFTGDGELIDFPEQTSEVRRKREHDV